MGNNIFHHNYKVQRSDREKSFGHEGKVLWFTGLSGSGKSTLANQLEYELFTKGFKTYVLDGDNLRLGLNQNLKFTKQDRKENLRRVAEVAKLFVDAGVVVLAAFISPLDKDRNMVKDIIGNDDYIQIYVNCSLETCEDRDVKGLYKKARYGEIRNFTGIDAPFEVPKDNDLVLHTDIDSVDECLEKLVFLSLQNIKHSF